jgi:hypothetical protein
MLRMLLVSVLLLAPDTAPDWKLVVDGEVKVYSRPVADSKIREVRAEMRMDATPKEVRDLLLDEDYARRTPYVVEARVLERPDPDTWIKYTRVSIPMLTERDWYIEIHRESDLASDGSGVFHYVWKPWGLDRPARSGTIRVTTNQGYWDVRSSSEPGHALVTYYLYSDPGGFVPAWAVNFGNKRVLPDLLKSVQKETLRRRSLTASKGTP